MTSNQLKQTMFITTVRTPYGRQRAGWMLDSLRSFGGSLAQSPVWLFESDPRAECRRLAQVGLTVIPLQVPDAIRKALFSEKVFAGAQAEAMAGADVGSLVWIDPGCLVVQPPLLYALDEDFDAAFRPVHIQNVGLRVGDPLDAFWQGIYTAVGLTDVSTTVQSFVDQQTLRAYYNSHAFAVNPARGLLGRWLEYFQALACDTLFQQTACQDDPHQIFIFQALLSALLVKEIAPQRLRILPPEYNYPFNLQGNVPAEYRARALNDVVTFAYEDRSLNPAEITDIALEEPLRSWLVTHCAA
jgi:hypothetical protein